MDWFTLIAMAMGAVITLVSFTVGALIGAAAASKKD